MPRALLTSLVLAALALALPAGAHADPACDTVAALDGSDGNAGTAAAPVRTVRRAVELLAPGETACLTAGQTFHELANLNPSGTEDAPLTLRSTPGGRAAITGQVRVNGSHVRITGIDFNGLGAVASFAPKTYHLGVDGDDVVLSDLDITSPKGICVDVGQIDAYGARRVRVPTASCSSTRACTAAGSRTTSPAATRASTASISSTPPARGCPTSTSTTTSTAGSSSGRPRPTR